MDDLPEDRQSANQQAQLAALLREEYTRKQTISRRPPSDTVPLSVAQKRFWFLDQLEPENPIYNRPMVLRLTGALDTGILSQAIDELLIRHEILRCTVMTHGGKPVQVISPTLHLAPTTIDLRSLPASAADKEAERLTIDDMSKPFNLAEGPLLRALLLHLDESKYLLVITMNHMLCDGWSAGIFVRELGILYDALSSGTPPSLPELTIQYADFAGWQQRQIDSDAWTQDIAYWKEKLAGAPPSLDLPTARPHLSTRTYGGHTQITHFPASLIKALTTLAEQEGATLFMVLLSAFKILLYRYTGQTDLVVGSPVAGRNHVELEGMVGFLTNTLALRSDLSGKPTFLQLLQRIRQVALDAYTHQELPFDTLLGHLELKRDISVSPLFQVMFNFENLSETVIETTKLYIEEVHLDTGMAPYDLTLELSKDAQGLRVACVYNTDLFDTQPIVRFLGHYQVLLEEIVRNPEERIECLPLLTAAERRQLLLEWNDTASHFPETSTVHELFELQAERTPETTAVESVDGQLSYDELNQLSNCLARHLHNLGVKRGSLVAIFMTRRLELAVGLLGILKAGCAYLPLDCKHPKERLAYLTEDAGPEVIVTETKLLPDLPDHSIQVVCLDDSFVDNMNGNEGNLFPVATATDLVYTIYTSGSTGKPKGVLVTHRSLVNNVLAVSQYFELKSGDRRLQMASVAFDVAAAELFSCWMVGATVVLWPDDETSSLDRFLDFVAIRRLSVAGLPTSLWHELVSEFEDSRRSLPPDLRLVVVGSEEALSDRLANWRKMTGDRVRWVNAYGPTETTITATLYEPSKSDAHNACRTVPIGRPIANTRIYILDDHLNLVPVGIPGEIHIGGHSLARGYLNRPELTADRFIANPFASEAGARLYRTGDQARYLPDGNIEFLGRVDQQVKIRGFRIEPGEVESAISRHPAVRQCVVVARSDRDSRKLVAYATVADSASLTESGLRLHLGKSLPSYMIPECFVRLEQMPLGPTGKIDRNALPAPDVRWSELESTHVAPRSPLEEQLMAIWGDVLGMDRIGVNDDFFALGGQSLDAMRITSRLANDLGIQIPLRMFFEGCTVAGLAEHLAGSDTDNV